MINEVKVDSYIEHADLESVIKDRESNGWYIDQFITCRGDKADFVTIVWRKYDPEPWGTDTIGHKTITVKAEDIEDAPIVGEVEGCVYGTVKTEVTTGPSGGKSQDGGAV